MLSPPLAATVFSFLAIAAAYFARPASKGFAGFERIFIVWLAVSTLGFLVPSNAASLVLIAVVLAVAAPSGPVNRVVLYVATFMALPTEHAFLVPFPGLNYLIAIDYGKLAALILLGPSFFWALGQRPQHLRAIDFLVGLFYFLTSIMAARELPLTSVLRVFVDGFLLMIIPYIVISRALRTREDFERALKAFFVGLLILAMIGIIATVRSWNFHELLYQDTTQFADYRGGFLRVSGPLMTTLMGFCMALGIAGTLEFGRRGLIGRLRWFGYLGLFAAVLYLSGSRGAWLAGAVAIATYVVYARMGGLMHRLYFFGAVAALVATPLALTAVDYGALDPYGTFRYRAELVRVSIAEVMKNPFFGSVQYGESEAFQHLVTGWGIIDFVNSYLQLALQFGLVGLLTFVAIAVLLVLACMRAAREFRRLGDAADRKAFAGVNGFLLAGVVGLFTMIATVSIISYVYHFIFLFFALAKGFASCSRTGDLTAPIAAPVEKIANTASPKPKPRREIPIHLKQYLPRD